MENWFVMTREIKSGLVDPKYGTGLKFRRWLLGAMQLKTACAPVVMDNDYKRKQCRRDKYKVNGRALWAVFINLEQNRWWWVAVIIRAEL